MTDPLYILAVLCLIIVVSEWLVRRTPLKHLGTALLVILVTALLANLGVLPAGSTPEAPVPVYDGIFTYVAPAAIFWLLLPVSLRDILEAGLPMIGLFLIGAAGTTLGVLVGMWAIGGPEAIGPLYAALGGMFTGTYIGGSVNFNAVAIGYDVMQEGILFGGAVVVDNIATTVWMIASLAMPRVLLPMWRRRGVRRTHTGTGDVILGIKEDTEPVHPVDLGFVLALGLGSVWLSELAADALASWGVNVPAILILTAIALVLAQIPSVARLPGTKVMGLFAVYLFLAVIGAFCDVVKLQEASTLGLMLLAFASLTVLVHGLFTFGAAWLFKLDLQLAAVASQANVGGGTSALAVARSLGRADLVLPGILVGALGNAIGTFIGFWVAAQGLPWLLG